MKSETHNPQWLSRKDVKARYRISDSSLARWINAGTFPEPQIIGAHCQRWSASVLDRYDLDPEAWKAAHAGFAA